MPSETGKLLCRIGLLFADAVIVRALTENAASTRA
ncbi:hypothetical protein BSY238_3037 [Methyloversatilis sp. RAC08]|nr:hypothetical protein BSY238_3037 [Methyloversatilis sp. RAC08]